MDSHPLLHSISPIERRGNMRREWKPLLLLILSIFLVEILQFVPVVAAGRRIKNENATTASSFEDTISNWEQLNYYQLLGLDPENDHSIDDIKIRKAYRAQAKRFHPDKVIVQNTTNETTQTINARFAKIAEAYQVLSDSSKREEYDRYLRNEQRLKETSSSRFEHASHGRQDDTATSVFQSWFQSDEPFDPFAIFDMVFGTDKSSTESFDPSLLFAEMARSFEQQQQQRQPIRTMQEQQEFVDEFGQIVLRIRQTEEYSDSYTRVLVQDFVEDWDPYRRQWLYVPLQPQPVVVEEGRRRRSMDTRNGLPPQYASGQWLWPGTVLTVGMRLEHPPFFAGLTSSCELVVTRLDQGDGEYVDVQWSSGVSLPSHRHHECGLWLEGSHLVVATLTYAQQLIWHSKGASDEDDTMDDFMDPTVHVASLDGDGALSVYRLEEPSELWKDIIDLAKTFPPPMQRAVAAVGGMSLSVDAVTHQPVRTVCIFSTSPAGCLRIGRLVLRLAQSIKRLIDRFMVMINP